MLGAVPTQGRESTGKLWRYEYTYGRKERKNKLRPGTAFDQDIAREIKPRTGDTQAQRRRGLLDGYFVRPTTNLGGDAQSC